MDLVTGAHAVAAVLLIISGALKIRDPAPTVEFLRSVLRGLSPGRWLPERTRAATMWPTLALVVGVGELVVGLSVLVIGGTVPAVSTAVIYLLFASLIRRAMSLDLGRCACFGNIDSRPTWTHLILDLLLAAVSSAAVAADTSTEVMNSQSIGGAPFVIAVGVVAGVLLVILRAPPDRGESSRPQRA